MSFHIVHMLCLKLIAWSSLPAASLKPSKDQRQAVNRWSNYVLGEDYIKEVAKRFPKTKEEKKKDNSNFDLVQNLHAAETHQLKPVEPAHKFEVTLEHDDLTDEKYELFKNYQIHVHHESPNDISSSSFKRFLCSSPLKRVTKHEGRTDRPMGSFHQCYRLDGRLIAMGVLDLLPHSVSGVYFVYHSDFEKWSFGKLSALREAALALEKGYRYYYMGFYIHNCRKMKYKCDYKPQYVLDPMSYEWYPFENKMRPLMDRKKFVSLAFEPEDMAIQESNTGHDNDHESEFAEPSHRDSSPDENEDSFVGPDGDTWKYHSPSKAAASGESLLSIRMPGIPKVKDIPHEFDLDSLQVHLGTGITLKTKNLMAWDDEPDITNSSSLKGIVAEFAACLGPEISRMVAMDFSRG
ncbi:hypothetical protein MBLNU457_g2498t1 [Dothideomycetes sp. NU457]